jgi:phospholipase/lecithinase/hemolysin
MLLIAPTATVADDPGIQGVQFSALIVFSGSLSDTGNYASVNGDFPPPYYKNRTTNGPAAVDILASKLHLNADPSLFLIGQQGGTNYAVLHANAYGDTPIDLPAQVEAYLGSHINVADPQALYFIFIGANDIVSATIEQDQQKSQAILNNGIGAVEAAFRKLYTAGARMFYAPNNVNLGIAPITRNYGVSARATQLTMQFNSMWEQKLRQLERELDITIFRFDFFRLIGDMLNSSATLGFTDVTDACLPLLAQGGCDLDRFAFIDDLLPTERIHEFFGNAMTGALVQQLTSNVCTKEHRCGRGDGGSQSYAVIRESGDSR